jgi:hypothetical protein
MKQRSPDKALIEYRRRTAVRMKEQGHTIDAIAKALEVDESTVAGTWRPTEREVLYCWSTGGGDYARTVTESSDISQCFEAFLTKPHLIIDDQEVHEWRRCRRLDPRNVGDESVDAWIREIYGG